MNTTYRYRLYLLVGLLTGVILASSVACFLTSASPQPPANGQQSNALVVTSTLPIQGELPLVIQSASTPVVSTLTPSPTLPSGPTATLTPTPEITLTPTVTQTGGPVQFAVIGDYGAGGSPEADVAALVKSWNPDFVITVGDNNYPDGEAETIDENIGQFYHAFIFPYTGDYGDGADVNRFFPSLGNHDWHAPDAQPYLDYFTLPGNERYYDFVWGAVHFFVIDSDSHEPDGVGSSSDQATWLQGKLAASTEPWNIVYFHHAPYSSARHGDTEHMQWPFKQWGADLVLAGHDHTYERILRDGLTYVVDGLGGNGRYDFQTPVEGSQVRYNDDYGAVLCETSQASLSCQFINRSGQLIDSFELTQP